MPRKTSTRPRPKSKQQNITSPSERVRCFLGDGSATEDGNETFRSAELGGQTDYDLDFTTSRVGLRSSDRENITRASERMQNQQPTTSSAARKSGNENKSPAKKRRKQLNPQKRERRYWNLVKKLQATTDCLIPKACFDRLVREILNGVSTEVNRLTITSLAALQEASEMYLTTLFQDAYYCTLHRGRVTLNVKDIELTRYLRGVGNP